MGCGESSPRPWSAPNGTSSSVIDLVATEDPMTVVDAAQDSRPSAKIADPVRRLVALSVDSALLLLIGGGVALAFSDHLSRAGAWGWTIGLAIVLTYGGLLNRLDPI